MAARPAATLAALLAAAALAVAAPAAAAPPDEASLHVAVETAEPGAAQEEITAGSAEGLGLALLVGIVYGIVLTVHAYRGVGFGEAPGHQEHAHDIRRGMAEHEPDVPTGTA